MKPNNPPAYGIKPARSRASYAVREAIVNDIKQNAHERSIAQNVVSNRGSGNDRARDLTARSGALFNSSNYGYFLTGRSHNANLKRSVWDVAGYPEIVYFEDHWNMHRRNGVANACINLMVNKTWQDKPEITDGELSDDEKAKTKGKPRTKFEREVQYLIKKFKLFRVLKGFDRRQRVGRYGGIFIGVKELVKQDRQFPIQAVGVKSITKLTPLFESQLSINPSHIETDLGSERYGDPTHFEYQSYVPGSMSPLEHSDDVIHWTRAFAWGEGADDGTIFGIPHLEAIFNTLLDMEKTSAAAAEGLYKNAKQRTVLNINNELTTNGLSDDELDAFEESVDDFSEGFDNMLTTHGMEVQTLNSTLSDPEPVFKMQKQMIAIYEGLPETEMFGQQTGKMATDQDKVMSGQRVNDRRENEGTDMIVSFLEHLINAGLLTAPDDEIIVTWPDMTDPSAGDKLELADKMASTNEKSYNSGGGQVFSNMEIRKSAGYDEEISEDALEVESYLSEGEGDEGKES